MKHLSINDLIGELVSLKADLAAYNDLWENSRRPGTVDADILLEERRHIWAKQAQVLEAIRRKAGPGKALYANNVFVR